MSETVNGRLDSTKVVLVTGASSGIGLATTLRFARAGCTVIAGVRDVTGATALHEALAREPLPVRIEALDVAEDVSVATAMTRVHANVGPVDVLVNNAGISMSSALELAPLAEARRIFEVNYYGMVRMVQAVLPAMRTRRSGAIINVSSISGLVPVPALAHYSASKAALESATETLAVEVARFGIRVSLVEPGVTRTPMFTRRSNLRPIDPTSPYLDDLSALYGYFQRALKNPLTPEDVAAVVERAVTSPRPQLRYLIGADAEALVRARRAFSDEDWVAGIPPVKAILGGREPSDT